MDSLRVTAQRDFINEWLYSVIQTMNLITYIQRKRCYITTGTNAWALLNESYTTYGQFRKSSGLTSASLSK